MYNYRKREKILQVLRKLSADEAKDLMKAVISLNNSLTQTLGEDWLNQVSGVELAYDLVPIMAGQYTPDEKGILQLRSLLTTDL